MDTVELLETLLEQHPKCRVCGDPSTTVRDQGNPKWGLTEEGAVRTSIDDWLTEVDPADVVGACENHLNTARKADGGWHERKQSRGPTTTWPQRRRAEKIRARTGLIEALGGDCGSCGRTPPPDEMQILVPGRNRKQFDITSQAEWYDYVRTRPALLQAALLRCVDCNPVEQTQNPRKLDARTQVIKAYGGECASPDCPRTEGLLVVSLPGTFVPRWPSGAKYNSAARCQHIVRLRFPPGWALACEPHRDEVRLGG